MFKSAPPSKHLLLSLTLMVLTMLAGCGGGQAPTSAPTQEATQEAAQEPTSEPTTQPGANPTDEPTSIPTSIPTSVPTSTPSVTPSPEPTVEPETEKTTQLDCGVDNGRITSNHLDDTAKAYILCKHNETRSQIALGNFPGLYANFDVATDMKRLQWDTNLEQVAQTYANQCEWQHNPNRQAEYNLLSPTDIHNNPINGTESVGENLAYWGSSNITSASWEFTLNGYDAWVEEGNHYAIGDYYVNDFCDTDACGHFTQVVWANTYKVGCAVNYCGAGTLASIGATYLVCNYASAGNYVSERPYETGDIIEEVCSTADNGQTVCRNGLTASSGYAPGI